jgi:hypothetical protein
MVESKSMHATDSSAWKLISAFTVIVGVAAYPVLYLYAHNIAIARSSDLLGLLGLAVTTAMIMWMLLTMLLRDLHGGMLITAAILILFFSYGHVFIFLGQSNSPFLKSLRTDAVLLPLWTLLLILVITISVKFKQSLPKAMPALLVFSAALVLPLLFQIGMYLVRSGAFEQRDSEPASTETHTVAAIEDLPDVYYIILDGYGRADVLEQNYDFDNSAFIEALQERGFYVAAQSFSNYPQTQISISSTLSMAYHDADQINGSRVDVKQQYSDMMTNSIVAATLTGMGYEFINSNAVVQDGDQLLPEASLPLLGETEFFYIVRKSSLLGALDRFQRPPGSAEQDLEVLLRQRISRKMMTLPLLAQDSIPTFIYAHYMTPHPPYHFTTSIYEGASSSMDGTPWLDRNAYVREVTGLNLVVLKVVDDILAQSETPPIIIIQGDHGPASTFYRQKLSWDMTADALASDMNDKVRVERFAILNAYYGPPEMQTMLYPSISPVNSFRVVLSYLTGTEMELLPDRSFVATFERPINFIELPELNEGSTP